MHESSPSPSRRRWFTFSLRTLLVLVTLVGLWLGYQINAERRQREAVAGLRDRHSSTDIFAEDSLQVVYDHQWMGDGQIRWTAKPPGPKWLQNLLGVDFFQSVVGVTLHWAQDEDLAQLEKLRPLDWLNLSGSFSDEGLNRLATFSSTESLTLDLSNAPDVTPEGLKFLGKLTSLKKLDLVLGDSTKRDGLTALDRLVNLEELSLRFRGDHAESIVTQLSALPHLRQLRLEIKRNGDQLNAGLARLGNKSSLESISLGWGKTVSTVSGEPPTNLKEIKSLRQLVLHRWTGPSLDYLSGLDNLEDLTLRNSFDLGETGLAALNELPKLRALHVEYCPSVTLQGLDKCPTLRELTIMKCDSLTKAGLAQLAGMSNLRKLTLNRCGGIKLDAVANCPSLEEIEIVLCGEIDDELVHLAQLTNLRGLRLATIRRLNLEQLPTISGLETLTIESCPALTDAGLARVAQLRNLKTLRLESSPALTDASLAALAQLVALESLHLSVAPGMTDTGLAKLAGISGLKNLYIHGLKGSAVTPAGVEQLRQSMPRCEIEYEGN